MLRMRHNTSAGHSIAPPEWEMRDASFVQSLYKITCGGCHRVTWQRDDATDGCPVCLTPGGLRAALEAPSRVPMPERCTCGSAHLRTRAELRTIVRVDNGSAAPPQPLAAPSSPGFHIVGVSCLACGRAVVPEPPTCASCGSNDVLREAG